MESFTFTFWSIRIYCIPSSGSSHPGADMLAPLVTVGRKGVALGDSSPCAWAAMGRATAQVQSAVHVLQHIEGRGRETGVEVMHAW